MGCLLQILLLPIQMMYFMWELIIIIIKSIIKFYIWCIKGITNITFSPPKKSTNKYKNTKESKFDKEANLWGLTKEDKRIAREERLSPADYIEAEERDNDDLIDDD